jgi:hypothetical protein
MEAVWSLSTAVPNSGLKFYCEFVSKRLRLSAKSQVLLVQERAIVSSASMAFDQFNSSSPREGSRNASP